MRGGKKIQREPCAWPEDSFCMPFMQKSCKDFCTAITSGLSKEQKQTWYFAGQRNRLQLKLDSPTLGPSLVPSLFWNRG